MRQEKNLNQLFEEYTKECQFSSQLSSETIKGYKAVFQLFQMLVPEIATADLLSTEMVTEFFKRLQTRERKVGRTIKIGVKISSIKTYWSKLHAFFEWLTIKSIIPKNPLLGIRPPQPAYNDIKALNENEVKKLYAAVSLHSKSQFILRRDTLMLSMLQFTGMRLGEFISLELWDIDIERQLLTVRSTTSKSKRLRLIPIHPTLLFHLKDYISERNKRKYTTPYLLASANGDRVLSRPGLKHWVDNLGHRAGVKFHLHQFRHSFAVNLAIKNVNAVKIQKLLGHSSLNMTMTYLRSIETDELQSDIQKLSL
ncbi:MAG: site-specific integrase [Flavipsychrobacter sp.]|nr:site-specific integrase [Flavipsychrobacter sp.]